MKNIFVTISSGYPKILNSREDKSEAMSNNQFEQIKEDFRQIIKDDFEEVGLTVFNKKELLVFDPKNFSHSDIVAVIQEHDYNYADFDGVSFPTTKYSDNGKDYEYYLEKRFDDYDFTLVVDASVGSIKISDAKYVDSVSISADSAQQTTPKNKAKQIEQKIENVTNTLKALRANSKYKQMEEYSRKNGIIRADIKLSKILVARLFVDVRGRIADYLMIGYFLKKKYFSIDHTAIVFSGNEKSDSKALERTLYGFVQAYQHRVEKGFADLAKKEKLNRRKF